ncbi:MAG: GNAT family N-acetyltransferase [Bacteroidales bacterium]|nr:GNAT family N-acetyltransferase [Bacteroidales bacterium]
MSEFELSIERAFDTEALSLFNSGVREIDLLIHKRSGGLLSFIEEVPCEFYVAKVEDEPVALFVLSDRMVTVNDEKYPSLEIDFIAVKQEWRNKGIGAHILQLAEQNAKDAEFSFLTTAAYFGKKYSAVGFYEKCGFVRNGDKQGNTIPMFKYLDYQYVKEL